MSKIRNQNGSGKSKLGGYVGPVEKGRGGSRKNPDDFSGAAPPNSSFINFNVLKKQIIATFFAIINFFVIIPGSIFITSCKDDTPTVNQAPEANAGINQTVNLSDNLTVTLNGTQSNDPDGNIVSYSWECTGYTPTSGVITQYTIEQISNMIKNSDKVIATVDLRKAGTYTFELTVKDNEGLTKTSNVKITVNPMLSSQKITAEAIQFNASKQLNLQLPSNNYTFEGNMNPNFSTDDLNGISYKLTSTNPTKNAEQLDSYIDNGKLTLPDYPEILYGDGVYPTITQTFYLNEQEIGNRKFIVMVCTGIFSHLHGYNPT